MSGREKNAHFRTHSLFWPKFFGPKQCKPGSTIKIVVSAEIAQHQKWHLFFWKRCLLIWVKKWVLLTVFLKSRVFLFFRKHYFYSVFSKHSSCNTKIVCWKNRKLWKIVGCFWTWKKVLYGCSFSGCNVIVVCFLCVWWGWKSVKMLVFYFPSFLGFVGWIVLVYLGFEGLGVFVFLAFFFFFSFLCWFCFCFVSVLFLFCFCFVSVLFLFCFCFVSVLFLFCLFWFCWIVFGVVFCFGFLLEVLRVRWGGPKGHLTWP